MDKININKTLDELKEGGIDSYDLRPLMLKGIRAKFRPDIYIDEKYVELRTSINDSFKATMQKLIDKFDTYENAVFFHNFRQIYDHIGLHEDEKGGMMLMRYETYGTNHSYIIQLVRYAVLNKFEDTLTEPNKIEDTLRNPDGFGYLSAVKYDVLGIEIQAYKNLKNVIRGLTDEQRTRITDAFALYKKYR